MPALKPIKTKSVSSLCHFFFFFIESFWLPAFSPTCNSMISVNKWGEMLDYYGDVRQSDQWGNGTCPKCSSHVVLSIIINLHTYVLCDMHYTLRNMLNKRQTYCKCGRRGTKKAFLTKGHTAWLKNGDWVWDSRHFHQAKKMLGTFTLANGCA